MNQKAKRGILLNSSKGKSKEKFLTIAKSNSPNEKIEIIEYNKVKNSYIKKQDNDPSKCKTHRPYIPTFIRDRNKIIKTNSIYKYHKNRYGYPNEKIYINNRYKLLNQSQNIERENNNKNSSFKNELNTTYDDLINYIKKSSNIEKNEVKVTSKTINRSSNEKNIAKSIDDDNNDINYYGNVYKRRRQYWSSKSSSRENKSNDSNDKNRILTYRRQNNLKEDLMSTLNDTKNIICKLPLSYISKKYIKLNLFPINTFCFISKEIIRPIILPTLDISFISKYLISSKVLPIIDNSFISKKIIKVIQMPLLDNHFMSKKIIKSTFIIPTSSKKRNLSEVKTKKNNSVKYIDLFRKIPINEFSFISKKIYIAKNIPILPLSFFSKTIISCLTIPKLDISFISKICKKEDIFKIPEKEISYITKKRIEYIKKPTSSINYISKKRFMNQIINKPISTYCYISKQLIKIYNKPKFNICYISKELMKNYKKPISDLCYVSKEKIYIFKKPKIKDCFVSKYLFKIFQKPLLKFGLISKNYIFQTQIIPLINQCYISKKFIISGYKKPILREAFITKKINKGIIPIKKPIIINCQIYKKYKKSKSCLSNSSSLSFIDNLAQDEEKIISTSIKEDIISTPIKSLKNFNFKNSNKDKISNSVNSQISKISKNSEKNISNFGSLQDDISSEFNEIDKKLNKKHPELEANIRQRREIEKEIEIQFDDFGMVKEINNSNSKNKNSDSEKKSNYSKNFILTEQSPQNINLSLSRSKNNSNQKSSNKKQNMSKSQQMDSSEKKNKPLNQNKSMKIPKFKFDKNMLFDLKYELNRRKKEKRIIQEYEYSNIRKATQKLNEVLLGKSSDNKKDIIESKIEIGANKLEEIIGKRKTKRASGQISVRKNNRYLHILEQEDKMNKLKNIEKILDNKFDLNPNNENLLFSRIKSNTPIKPTIKKLFKTSEKSKNSARKQKKEKLIPKSNSINLQFILSLKLYPHSLDSYQLPNKVIEHCNSLKNPSYMISPVNLIKTSEKKKSPLSISKENKIQNKRKDNKENKENKENKLYEGLMKAAKNYNNNMAQWARKDMTKEIEIAENYVKELNSNMEKNSIKHDITSILNTLTVDNFNDVKDKLFNLLNKNNDNQDKLIEVILEKSIIENGYIILYAKLCKELINILEEKNECYLKTKLIEVCKNSFDKAENEFDSKIILNDDQYYHQKKKILGNINLIADLIDVKILSQKIGFYCINTLYDRFSKSNNNNDKSMKFINLEALIAFLSKFGKIIIKRNKKEKLNKLKTFIYEKITIIKDQKEIPGFLKYKIINLLEKEKNNWQDTLFEKSIIPKGKEKLKLINEDDYDYKKLVLEDEDAIKEDLTNWINYLNENDIITPSELAEEILNEYEWENIDKLISDEKVELVEIIRCFLEVSIDLINKKEDIFKANQYINSVIEFYSKFLSKEEIDDCNKKLMLLFIEVNNLVVDNSFMFEILGNLLFASINDKLCSVNDLDIFIGSEQLTLQNISKVIKYAIGAAGNKKFKFIDDLKHTKLFNNQKELFNSILSENHNHENH